MPGSENCVLISGLFLYAGSPSTWQTVLLRTMYENLGFCSPQGKGYASSVQRFRLQSIQNSTVSATLIFRLDAIVQSSETKQVLIQGFPKNNEKLKLTCLPGGAATPHFYKLQRCETRNASAAWWTSIFRTWVKKCTFYVQKYVFYTRFPSTPTSYICGVSSVHLHRNIMRTWQHVLISGVFFYPGLFGSDCSPKWTAPPGKNVGVSAPVLGLWWHCERLNGMVLKQEVVNFQTKKFYFWIIWHSCSRSKNYERKKHWKYVHSTKIPRLKGS